MSARPETMHENDMVELLLRTGVLDDADYEELSHIKSTHSAARRKAMGMAVRAADTMASTRPHVGVESATANLLVGPYTAMMDRAGAVIRHTLRRSLGH